MADVPGAFALGRLPQIEFGTGVRHRIPERLRQFGTRFLLVTGGRSLTEGPFWPELQRELTASGLAWEHFVVAGEPSPVLVDEAVRQFRGGRFSAVLAIGGGSALDAGKAIAGLLVPGNSVLDHLEGVGPEVPYRGPAVPLVAVPTTAGTGAEATRNAVLSLLGPDGYKKSFRDELLVPRHALVDPDFLQTCPSAVIAANGMDALTQLLESYLSIRANPICDSLALDGLALAGRFLARLYRDAGDADARSAMAYAAMLSGITLAHTGLGAVHGLASPLGAFFPIAHGVVCGGLVAAATRVNIEALRARAPEDRALWRYAEVGRLLTGHLELDDHAAADALVNWLEACATEIGLPGLGQLGLKPSDHHKVVAHSRGSSMRTNPIVLTDAEVTEILLRSQ
jgi:alcohol dehydrogenase class IV